MTTDTALDGHYRSYSAYRAGLSLLLSSVWLTAFPMYVDIYNMHHVTDHELAEMACSCASARKVPLNVSNMCSCDLPLECKRQLNIAASFDLFCVHPTVLSLPPVMVIAGIFFGALLGGITSDRFGRRRTLLGFLAVQFVASALAAAAPSYPAYLALRLLCGVGMSGVTQAGYTLATEVVGPRYRTILTAELWAYVWAAMSCLLALVAYLMRHVPWRSFQLILAIPTILVWLALFALAPESPRWLEGRGEHAARDAVLQRLLGSVPLLARSGEEPTGKTTGGAAANPDDAPPATKDVQSGAKAGKPEEKHEEGDAPAAAAAAANVPVPSVPAPSVPAPITPAHGGARPWCAGVCSRQRELFSSCDVARVTCAEMFVWGACTLSFYGVQFNAVNLDPAHFYVNEVYS